ncbi:FAD-dependent oxidoreductase [Fodinicola feengrottensis]|uniref:FAD-dependent oxidoreductase n=3 Tax=Fodinicola feengrottensis TaxID=435914 RepID=A0ABN2JD30_9ACTN
MVLGLLLARAGVEVVVLEKHPDFLRDFRGDTVHPSTLTLLDELGLSEQFDQMPHRDFDKLSFTIGDTVVQFADFSQINWPHKCVRMVPQWDFLSLLSRAAADEPTFHLAMETEVTSLIRDGEQVAGVRYRTAAGETGEIRADLTVGCDGRHSRIRREARLPVRETPVPVDAWWFSLPRNGDTDLEGGVGRFYPGHMFVMQDRGDYWQVAYLFRKGTNDQRRSEPITLFQEQIAKLLPWVADGVKALTSWDEIPFLDVKVNRLQRWYGPGVLCIGDAAHAMSPAGGPGVNLAVQDAVAAARVLAPALLRGGGVSVRELARIQSRRAMPAMVIQTLQRVLHATVFEPVLAATGELKMPLLAKMIIRYPLLRRMPARMIGIGPRPEHAPGFARRPAKVA